MTETLSKPLLGLGEVIPESLWVLHHPASGKYACYMFEGVHGLACFSTEQSAFQFAKHIELTGMEVQHVSFDEAREIAKSRPLPVTSLMLVDSMDNPTIHYIR